MSERDWKRSNPRKIITLFNLHKKFNGWDVKDKKENKEERVYIDQVPFL